MTREEFDRFVNEIEDAASRDPGPIKRKIQWLVFTGYAVIAGMLLLSVSLRVFSIAPLFWHINEGTIKIAALLGVSACVSCYTLRLERGIFVYQPPLRATSYGCYFTSLYSFTTILGTIARGGVPGLPVHCAACCRSGPGPESTYSPDPWI